MQTVPHTLYVTLKDGNLDVDEHNHVNRIPHGQDAEIQWVLTGNAASGSFNSTNDPHPGFKWIQPPPDTVFGPIEPAADGKQMKMSDDNANSGSTGTWTYQLYATIDGTEYKTETTKNLSGTTTDPTIQNLSPT